MGSVVHEHVGVIILAVFIVIAVFGPVYVTSGSERPFPMRPACFHPISGRGYWRIWLTRPRRRHRGCIFFTRRREHKKYHPSPKAFRKARTKLGTVADCRRDTEKGLSGDPEWTDNW